MLREIKLLEYRATQRNMKANYRVLFTRIQVIIIISIYNIINCNFIYRFL